MISFHISMFLLPLLFASAWADGSLGCFSSVDTSNAKGYQTYGSQSSCSKACGDEYPYVAMRDGAYCYCLTSMPSSNQVSESQCNVKCNGWGEVNCGGSTTFTVFSGQGTDTGSDSSASSSAQVQRSSSAAATSSSQQAKSSQASSTQASTKETSSELASTSSQDGAVSSVTSVATVSGSESSSKSVMYRTVTQTSASKSQSSAQSSASASTSASTSASASASASSHPTRKKTNVAPIVGGVVGGIAGVLILGLAAFFLLRRHNARDEDDEEDFYKKGATGATLNRGVSGKSQKFNSVFDMPMANPFVHPSDEFAEKSNASAGSELSDPRLNPAMMGRRRLSEGSLADEADYSRKILGVANP